MRKISTCLVALALALPSASFAGGAGRAVMKGTEIVSHGSSAGQGAYDESRGRDRAMAEAACEAGFTAGTIGYGVGSAYAAGAGSLTGYAGIASTVSSMGLGGVTTSIAGAMGSSATGAAATAVVTSAVGGPVVMAGILVGGTAAVSYGLYKGGKAVWRWATK